MENQDQMQKVILYQLLTKHLEELKQQAVMLEQRFIEFETTKNALGDFKEIKGKEMLVPMGSGCYAHGTASDKGDILVNIGHNIMLKKPVADTVKLLEERVKEVEGYSKQLHMQMESVINQITTLAKELEALQK